MSEKQLSVIDGLKQSENSLMKMVDTYKDRLMKRASNELKKAGPDKQEQFMARTVANIIKNEKLKDCFMSPEGKVSIYMLIDDALKTGLELEKHAYAIPYKKNAGTKQNPRWVSTASFQIKDRGYHALLCGSEQPIFKDLKWGVVYENEKDNVKIDRASGEISHPVSISDNRGNPVGVWVQATKLDGSKEAEFYPKSFIENIRNNHSKPYQDYVAKKISSCTWITDEIPMWTKTAIKSFCRPYADVVEALQNAYYSEGDNIVDKQKDIADIALDVIDSAIENLDGEIDRSNVKEENHDNVEVVDDKPEDGKKVLF